MMNSFLDFTHKTVLVTGASRGIGRACAQQFARLGARVAVHYGSNSQVAIKTLESLQGSGHLTVQADLTDANQIPPMVETVLAGFHKIDILVNSAGIFEESPLPGSDYDQWQATWNNVFSTNLFGLANASYCVAQSMILNGGGKIINISSRTAFRGKPEAPAYAASKAALNALSQNLAITLAPHNIMVHVIAPGVVETDMAANDKASPAWQAIQNQSPLGRVCQPEEVAQTAAFLASNQADYLTGGIVDMFGASYLRN